VEVPTVVDEKANGLENTFLTEIVINKYIDKLNESMKVKKDYDELIDFIKSEFDACTDAKKFNEFVLKIPELKHIGSSLAKARELLKTKSKELNLTFNKEVQIYEKI
jgi:hypothetical protein